MNILTDAQVLIAAFNFITGITNIIWSIQLRGLKNDGEIIKELKDSNADKIEIIDTLKDDKERWKTQYHSLLVKFKEINGKLQAYERFHKHNGAL